MDNLKTGIYIRVSTEEQVKHGFSIRAQQENLTSYAKLKNWEIIDFYIDEGISGKDLNRPSIQRLLKDIENNEIKNVLVYKIDRLTRSTKDLIDLIELFQKHNCEFNSLTESIDTSSPTGRMFIKIIGLFAEFERETIVERIKVGLKRKVKEGYSLCSSTTSLGYKRKKGQKIQQIDPKESLIVKKIYNLFLNGKTIKEIKEILEQEHLKTKKNCQWTTKNILNILSNPNYIGNVRYGIKTNKYFEVTGKHKQIITNTDYLKVHDKLKNRLRTKSDAYYSNKLQCLCQGKLKTKRTYIKNKCYINYLCPNNNCPFKSISHHYLDHYLKIENDSFAKRFEYVQNHIVKLSIVSLKKDIEVMYTNVNTGDNRFTLTKK